MLTIKLKYKSDFQDRIELYSRQYSSILHVFYNQLVNEKELQTEYAYLKQDSILKTKFRQLNNVDLMNDWFCRSAIAEAYQLVKSEPESKVVFGGRGNLIRRSKLLISREEFLKNKKLNPLYSIGTAKPYKGNQKFEISEDLQHIIFKPSRNEHIELTLNVQHRKPLLAKLYKRQQLKDFPITYKLDKNYIYISYDEKELEQKQSVKYVHNRIFGIDLNPNYVGWTITDWKSENEYKIVKSGVYSLKPLNDKDYNLKKKHLSSESKERKYITNKRHHEIYQIIKNIINKAIYYKCQIISIEDLNIKSSDKQKGKKYNKLVNNNWCRDIFENSLTKYCNIYNIKLQKVKANYSSFIGNFLFRSLNLPDMCLASFELGRRAYEYNAQYIEQCKIIKHNIVLPDVEMFKKLYLKSLEEF